MPNAIISPISSFGIMPAPGADNDPNGRSPASRKTMMPKITNAAPATWTVRRIIRCSQQTSRKRSSHLPNLTDRVLGAPNVFVPELRELCRRQIAWLKTDIGERSVELRAGGGLVDGGDQRRDDRGRRALGGEQPD